MSEARAFAERAKEEYTNKANHNKRESLVCFIMILVCSLSAPLFITLGDSKLISKAIPSILSVLSAGFTSWLQLRKPQRLWSMYRGAQRLVEVELAKYQFLIGDYKSQNNPDSHLVEKISEIMLATHDEWNSVIPSPENSFQTTTNNKV